jgi:hypothetical protein
MSSVLHEAPFDYLKDCFRDAFATLPYNRYLIRPLIHMAWPLKLEDQMVRPDMTISLTATGGPTKLVSILSVAECALSEKIDHIYTKVQDEIDAHPEVVLAIIALIREVETYESPKRNSPAWRTLCNADDAPKPLLLDQFVDLRSTPRVFDEPVTVAGHNWCHLASVEYVVWIKSGEEKIDISNEDAQYMARGVRFLLMTP